MLLDKLISNITTDDAKLLSIFSKSNKKVFNKSVCEVLKIKTKTKPRTKSINLDDDKYYNYYNNVVSYNSYKYRIYDDKKRFLVFNQDGTYYIEGYNF